MNKEFKPSSKIKQLTAQVQDVLHLSQYLKIFKI